MRLLLTRYVGAPIAIIATLALVISMGLRYLERALFGG